MPQPQRLSDATDDVGDLIALWRGELKNGFAAQTVIGTAAVALLALGSVDDLTQAQDQAGRLWAERSAVRQVA